MKDGGKVRAQIVRHLQEHDGENKDHGIELDYRYTHLLVIVPNKDLTEPVWINAHYAPQPGRRQGHRMFSCQMEDKHFDLFGTNYTFVDFSKDGQMARIFCGQGEKACNSSQASLPSERVSLQNI